MDVSGKAAHKSAVTAVKCYMVQAHDSMAKLGQPKLGFMTGANIINNYLVQPDFIYKYKILLFLPFGKRQNNIR